MWKRLLFIGACVAIFVATHGQAIVETGPTDVAPFTDLGASDAWAGDAIRALAEKGIVGGVADGAFAPDRPVTREQFAKMLALAFDADVGGSVQSFVDVTPERWSFGYVEAAKDWIGANPGRPINEFGPDGICTRETAAAAVTYACGLAELPDGTSYLESRFSDASQTAEPLRGAVASAVERELIRSDGGYLRPQEPLTRAEAAVLLARGMERTASPGPSPSDDLSGETSIVGEPQISAEQAARWATSRGADQRYVDVAPLYWSYGALSGIRPEVLYAQAAKETNFGRYTGNVQPEQNNWAGIKTVSATGDRTEDHESFASADDGVRAHFNHMAAYVGVSPVGEPHGRYEIARVSAWGGTVRYVEELGGKWAPEATYGQDLILNYLNPMMAAN